MSKRLTHLREMASLSNEPIAQFTADDLMPLKGVKQPPLAPPRQRWLDTYDFSLDGFSDFEIPAPKTDAEKQRLVEGFLRGLEKLFDPANNWTFVKIFQLSMEYCVRCQTCSEACHTYIGSGRQEIYRPTFRSEILRRIYQRYHTTGGKWLPAFYGVDIEVNFKTVWRLLELAYRCNLCRRCVMTCPVGVDNALIAREIRKLFSQEMGLAPTELLKKGTRQHLKTGSTTGMNPTAAKSLVADMQDQIGEKIGRRIEIPVDKKGADILLIHNAGEFLSWPENPAAFAILFDAVGLNWTLSSDLLGYDGVNYGVWFDDVELARVALRHLQLARDLGVKKIVVGECGHAHKALMVIADRVFPGDLSLSEIPRESCLPLLAQIAASGRIRFDPQRNDFPVTLHDSCNVVRLMGIVKPQREIIQRICAQPLREMTPHGVWNYCCGGGSGFAIMNSLNFADWRKNVSGRMKTQQILDVFADVLDPRINKYVIAACSNCKGTIRDMSGHFGLWDQYHIHYGGLVDLMVNAMADLPKPYLEWPPA